MVGLNAEAVTLAGAFVVGIIAGSIGAIRLTRVVADSWDRNRQRASRRRQD